LRLQDGGGGGGGGGQRRAKREEIYNYLDWRVFRQVSCASERTSAACCGAGRRCCCNELGGSASPACKLSSAVGQYERFYE